MKQLVLSAALAVIAFGTGPVIADEHGGKRHHKGAVLKNMDTDGNGSVSQSEFSAASEKRFQKMDADGDGSITQQEAKDHRAKRKEKRQERREKYRDARDSE